MRLNAKLVGYSKRTERVVSERPIPADLLLLAREIVGIKKKPSEPFVDYPLSEAKAVRLTKLLGEPINRRLDYFFQVSAARAYG